MLLLLCLLICTLVSLSDEAESRSTTCMDPHVQPLVIYCEVFPLQTVEMLNMNIERTQTPPYYRLSQLRKSPAANNTTDDEKLIGQEPDVQLQKGVLHTKRHSANEDLQNER